jgi:hypothetical protein
MCRRFQHIYPQGKIFRPYETSGLNFALSETHMAYLYDSVLSQVLQQVLPMLHRLAGMAYQLGRVSETREFDPSSTGLLTTLGPIYALDALVGDLAFNKAYRCFSVLYCAATQ